MSTDRPFMFDRTSTYRVLEFTLTDGISNIDSLTEAFRKRDHKRTEADIKRMLAHFERIEVIDNWQVHERFKNVLLLDPENTEPLTVKTALDMLEYLQEKKMMAFPFLEAMYHYPKKAGTVAAKARELCNDYGYYHVRVDRDDNAPAMKNFLALLKLAVPGRGKYELTPLGKAVIEAYIRPETSRIQRAKCRDEQCRKVCPANAIDPYRITTACIQCGLCVKACPYGGITVEGGKYVIDPGMCSKEEGQRGKTQAGPIGLLTGMEDVLQEWLTSLFHLGGWEAVIPGRSGSYTDVVVVDRPVWIECKVKNVTKKHLVKVVEQIKGYQAAESIERTIEQVRDHTGRYIEVPELFLLCAPGTSDVKTFLEEVSSFDIPTGFISVESLHGVSDYLVRSNQISWAECFPEERTNVDYSDLVKPCKENN